MSGFERVVKRGTTMSNELKKCPCGKTPDDLFILEGETFRWRKISGNCCDYWTVEARINGKTEDETKQQCVEAWNDAPRGFV